VCEFEYNCSNKNVIINDDFLFMKEFIKKCDDKNTAFKFTRFINESGSEIEYQYLFQEKSYMYGGSSQKKKKSAKKKSAKKKSAKKKSAKKKSSKKKSAKKK